jgi:AraC-like DNA-binding protein
LLNLVYAAPSPALADYVSAFYLFEIDELTFADIERADIAQLRFSLSGSGDITFGTNDTQPFSAVTLIGPRMQASTLRVTGPAVCFGMGLLPAGWCALTGLPAHDFANRVVDARGRICGDLDALRIAVAAAEGFQDMVAASEHFVADVVAKAETPPFRLIRAVDEWLETNMDPDVGDLAEQTGLSAAQLQRQLKAIYGASPKLLARKYRALKTAVRIANGEGVWQDYVGGTYYDQSHCIREIKAFTGVTPEAIRKTPRLTKATFERRKLKGKISTLATEI